MLDRLQPHGASPHRELDQKRTYHLHPLRAPYCYKNNARKMEHLRSIFARNAYVKGQSDVTCRQLPVAAIQMPALRSLSNLRFWSLAGRPDWGCGTLI